MLEEHGFIRVAQSFNHLGFVPVDTLVDVIVGVNLCLDVLQNTENKGFSQFKKKTRTITDSKCATLLSLQLKLIEADYHELISME